MFQFLATTTAVLLLMPAFVAAQAAQQKPPDRQPKKAVAFNLKITVPWSTFELGDDRDEVFSGNIKCWPSDDRYLAATDLALRNGSGRIMAIPDEISFQLTKEGDAFGGKEELTGAQIPEELRYRLLSASDFGLVALRMLFCHEMPTSRGGKPASRVIDHEDYHVSFEEKFSGVETVSRTPLRKFACRTVRTFRPSGFQLVDYTMTFEDEKDNTVLGSYALRMLVHPSRELANGQLPPAGVFHLGIIEAYQNDWKRETIVIRMEFWSEHFPEWIDRLGDDLFTSIATDAIGDPFRSPSVFALRILQALNERSLHRLASKADPRMLAPVVPLLSTTALAYDPSRFTRAWEQTYDPVERLLLAAAAVMAGEDQDEFRHELKIACHSKHPNTLRAAFHLALAYHDPELARSVSGGISNASREEDKILGLRALAATGGPAARVGIEDTLLSATSDRLRAAALLALASLGDPDDEGLLGDADARFGAVNPRTGIFELLLTDANRAGDGLFEVWRLAQTINDGNVERILRDLDKAVEKADSTAEEEFGVAWTARLWMLRLGHLVPKLADRLDDRNYGRVARDIVHAAGRSAIDDILGELIRAKGEQKNEVARLLGATRDPRARELLLKLQDSDDMEEADAGDAGINELLKGQ